MESNSDCLFCKIAKKEIPSDIIYEDEKILVFKDIHPVAPVHVLLIPKMHITSINQLDDNNLEYIKAIFKIIPEVAQKLNVFETGYRVISNTGEDGGQVVKHLHFHLIGGKHLGPKIIRD